MRKIRITYDQSSRYPKVYDVETGAVLPSVEIDWHADMDNIPTAVVKILMVEIDAVTNAKILKVCSRCEREYDERGEEVRPAPA